LVWDEISVKKGLKDSSFQNKTFTLGHVDYAGESMITNKSEKLADHGCVDVSMLQI
jgi:hypothetical protein